MTFGCVVFVEAIGEKKIAEILSIQQAIGLILAINRRHLPILHRTIFLHHHLVFQVFFL